MLACRKPHVDLRAPITSVTVHVVPLLCTFQQKLVSMEAPHGTDTVQVQAFWPRPCLADSRRLLNSLSLDSTLKSRLQKRDEVKHDKKDSQHQLTSDTGG